MKINEKKNYTFTEKPTACTSLALRKIMRNAEKNGFEKKLLIFPPLIRGQPKDYNSVLKPPSHFPQCQK